MREGCLRPVINLKQWRQARVGQKDNGSRSFPLMENLISQIAHGENRNGKKKLDSVLSSKQKKRIAIVEKSRIIVEDAQEQGQRMFYGFRKRETSQGGEERPREE